MSAHHVITSQVEDLTGVTRPRARTLLIFFRWDVEAVMSEFIERGVEVRAHLYEPSVY